MTRGGRSSRRSRPERAPSTFEPVIIVRLAGADSYGAHCPICRAVLGMGLNLRAAEAAAKEHLTASHHVDTTTTPTQGGLN